MTFLPLNSAAAVISDDRDEATNTPCCQLNAWYTNGTHVGRRPPKRMALIGTPAGFSQSLSMIGQFLLGEQNLEFACAAL